MDKNSRLTKILAVVGTSLVWLVLLTPVFFWQLFSLRRGVFSLEHFDYLIPAELFLVALVGGSLLVWAAWRTRHLLKLIAGSLVLAIVSLFSGQVLAVLTGLASGETKPGGWEWALVLGSIVIYILALVGMGTGGILLCKELVKTAGTD